MLPSKGRVLNIKPWKGKCWTCWSQHPTVRVKASFTFLLVSFKQQSRRSAGARISEDESQLTKIALLRIRKFNAAEAVLLLCCFFFPRKIHLQHGALQRFVTIYQPSIQRVSRLTQPISRVTQPSLLSLMETEDNFSPGKHSGKSMILGSFSKMTIWSQALIKRRNR